MICEHEKKSLTLVIKVDGVVDDAVAKLGEPIGDSAHWHSLDPERSGWYHRSTANVVQVFFLKQTFQRQTQQVTW